MVDEKPSCQSQLQLSCLSNLPPKQTFLPTLGSPSSAYMYIPSSHSQYGLNAMINVFFAESSLSQLPDVLVVRLFPTVDGNITASLGNAVSLC